MLSKRMYVVGQKKKNDQIRFLQNDIYFLFFSKRMYVVVTDHVLMITLVIMVIISSPCDSVRKRSLLRQQKKN